MWLKISQNPSTIKGKVKGNEFPRSLPGTVLSLWSSRLEKRAGDNLRYDVDVSRQARSAGMTCLHICPLKCNGCLYAFPSQIGFQTAVSIQPIGSWGNSVAKWLGLGWAEPVSEEVWGCPTTAKRNVLQKPLASFLKSTLSIYEFWHSNLQLFPLKCINTDVVCRRTETCAYFSVKPCASWFFGFVWFFF